MASSAMSQLAAARQIAAARLAAPRAAAAPADAAASFNPFGASHLEGVVSKPTSAHAHVPASPVSGGASPAAPAPAFVGWQGQGHLLQDDPLLDVSPEEFPGQPLLIDERQAGPEVEAQLCGPSGARATGKLSMTQYLLRFSHPGPMPHVMAHYPKGFFCVPFASIRKIETRGGAGTNLAPMLELTCKDARLLQFLFKDEAVLNNIAWLARNLAFPVKLDLLFAFASTSTGGSAKKAAANAAATAAKAAKAAAAEVAGSSADGAAAAAPLVPVPASMPQPLPGWDVFTPEAEFDRLGVLRLRHPSTGEPLFRLSRINADFVYSPTYPSVIALPARASDAHMSIVAGFRSKARVPALTWLHPGNKTSLSRCSQPRVGMGGKTCAQDEQLVAWYREANLFSRGGPGKDLLVADCRPHANAVANNFAGGGYEQYKGTQLHFCNIHNIHAVRDAHRKLEALVLNHALPSDTTWATAVAETQWLTHLRTVLAAGFRAADAMHRKGQCVLVHCTDGWDRTAQVCCLVQVLLDPYARTMRGFCSLIAKEWCSFGHKFGERAGHTLDKPDGGDISPVFVQFMDAIAQLVRLFPSAFEFNGSLPLLFAHHLYSCRFGTFLGNNERERAELNLPLRTPSLWAYVLGGGAVTDSLRAREYDPRSGDVLLPPITAVLRNVTLWGAWFLRWAPYPSNPAACRLERYGDAYEGREFLAKARLPPLSSPLPSSAAVTATAAAATTVGGAGAPAVVAAASGTTVVAAATAAMVTGGEEEGVGVSAASAAAESGGEEVSSGAGGAGAVAAPSGEGEGEGGTAHAPSGDVEGEEPDLYSALAPAGAGDVEPEE